MKLTVAASIVVKWYVSEKHSEEARLLLAHRLERYAPDILLAECANTFWKKARRREIVEPQQYFQELSMLQDVIVLYSGADLIERAAQIAVQIDHPVYDCLYVACAEATGSVLITADRRLKDAVVGSLPDVDVQCVGAHGVAERISAAASTLVIGQDKLAELVAAHDPLLATDENVLSALTAGTTGLAIIGPEDLPRIPDSPAGRRLDGLFLELNDEERIDLLALGWLGQGQSSAEWPPIFERACTMIDAYADDKWHYVLGLGAYWRVGFERLTGVAI